MISFDSLYWLVKNRVRQLEGFTVHIGGATNTNPIVVTSVMSHHYITGQLVKLEGIKGNTAANGSYYIKVITPTKFELYKQLNGISNVTNTSPILATITGHNFNTGNKIKILGIQGNTAANGVFYVRQSGKAISNAIGTPILNISTFTNTSPVVVTVLNHGLITNDIVEIITPSVAANITGRLYVNVLTINTFEIYYDKLLSEQVDGTLIGAFEGVGTMQKQAPIVVTAINHGFATKNVIKIIDVVGEPIVIDSFYIKVLNANNFELYSDSAISVPVISTSNYVSGGIVALASNYDLELYTNNFLAAPFAPIPSIGNGVYISGGQVFSIPVVGNGEYTEGGYVKKDFVVENDFKDTFPGVPSNIYESIVKRIRS